MSTGKKIGLFGCALPLGAFITLGVIGAALGDSTDGDTKKPTAAETTPAAPTEPSPTATPTTQKPKPKPEIADYTGKNLATAQEEVQAPGYTVNNQDASDQDREVITPAGWTVCFQEEETFDGNPGVTLYAVKTGEPCPTKTGGPIPWPVMPDVTGDTYNKAITTLTKAGIKPAQIKLDDVYLDIDTPTAADAAEEGDDWRVCFQTPTKGTDVKATVRLDLGNWSRSSIVQKCPASKNTTYNIPVNDPNYDRDKNSSTSTGGSSTGGSSAYYRNCDAARTAGAAPIYRGQPGYRTALDRDGDGIACDK